MSNNSLATVNISPELIQPIIEQHIKAALVQALGKSDQIIDSVVNKILYSKVDSTGRVNDYSSYNTNTYMDFVFRTTIEAAVKEEVSKWAQENTAAIRAAIVKQMSTKKNTESFARAMIDGVANCMKSTHQTFVKMEFKSDSSRD